MKNPNQRITLTIRRPKPTRHDLIGAVKITPDAEVALRELSEQTGLPMRLMLEPCPCCGAEASLHRTVQRVAYVMCSRCRLQTPFLPTTEAAEAVWNRRTTPNPISQKEESP